MPTTSAAPDPASANHGTATRRTVQALLSIAIVGGVFLGVLPRIASFSDVGHALGAMTIAEMLVLGAVALGSLMTYALVLMASLPGLTFGQSMVATQSSTAIANTVPAGGAVGIGVTMAMYGSWGFRRAAGALSVLVSGIWNTLTKLALPVAALGLVALLGKARAGLVVGALAGVAALVGALAFLVAALHSDRIAHRFGTGLGRVVSRGRQMIGRSPVERWGDAAVGFRRETIELVRERWLSLSLTTLVGQLSPYVVLLIALRNLGVSDDQVGWAEVLAAFAFVRLVSALPITPGGLGVVELGLTAALIGAGGGRPQVVAAVLVFRALTYLAPIPCGVATYVVWRRRRAWRRPLPQPAV